MDAKGLQKIESAIEKKISENSLKNLTQSSVIFWPEVTLTKLIQKNRIDELEIIFLMTIICLVWS